MRRRDFIALFGGATLAWPVPLRAQVPADRPVRIGILRISQTPTRSLAALRRGLVANGYAEGRQYVFVFRFADGDVRALSELAKALVADGVDLIVTEGHQGTQAARVASESIPIVMATHPDPQRSGLIDSLARPGRNVTGNSSQATDVTGKLLELAKEIVPRLKRVAHIWPRTGRADLFGAEAIPAARSLGLEIVRIDLALPDVEGALRKAIEARAQVAVVRGRPFFSSEDARSIVERAAAHRLPVIYESRDFVELGGLMAFGVDVPDLYRRVANYIAKILKGAKPADLPVEQPTRFELVVNMKAAKALGITIPHSILLRADEVIE